MEPTDNTAVTQSSPLARSNCFFMSTAAKMNTYTVFWHGMRPYSTVSQATEWCPFRCVQSDVQIHTIPYNTITLFNFFLTLPQAQSTLVQCSAERKQWERAKIGITKVNKNGAKIHKTCKIWRYMHQLRPSTRKQGSPALHTESYKATQQSR
jgi:hypothetical protein